MIQIKMYVLLISLLLSTALFSQTVLDNILNPSRLPYLKKSKLIQISSFDSSGGNNDRINIHDGEKVTIAEMDGPGVITRIWITIDSRDPYFLRRIVLRMYWDGEGNPSVEVPIGDFFGTGFQYKHYMSAFVGMSSGGYYCYFPMPFNKSARIEVENNTGQEVYAFYYHIDYQKLEEPLEDDVAYFHAQWRRDLETDPKENYTILEAEGEGHFVGCNMNMQNYRRSLGFLEGDEMVYVDGEKFPSVYGTGTEDYFTGGWYFNRGEFDGQYHGLIIKDDSLARISTYRFHVGDVIPFNESIKFTIEHGHANEVVGDYSSTAYWYQKEPHKKFEPLPKASLRIPLRFQIPRKSIDAEILTFSGKNVKTKIMDMSDFGPEWKGLKQLYIESEKPGDSFNLTLNNVEEDRYHVDVYYTLGPAYADVEIFYDSKKVGEFNAYSPEILPGGMVRLKDLKVQGGKIPLQFKITGKSKESTGYAVGLDVFAVQPNREWIPEWYLIGPFPNERKSDTERFGLDTIYPPENEINLKKTYSGVDGQEIQWKLQQTPESGYFSMWKKFNPFELVVVYALTYIYSPEEQIVPFLFSSDDGSKVFLNDEEIYRFLEVRIAQPDDERIQLKLKKGWNKLLLKIENNFGGYAFYARVLDLNDNLVISADKKK